MKILFHTNQFGSRGTETAVFDYAHYNETLLGNESYIVAPDGSDMFSFDKFRNRFNSRAFVYSSLEQLQEVINVLHIDVVYWIKAGFNDGKLLPGIKNVVHSVFNIKEPHGDVYAYVSKWLAEENKSSYVPHIVQLPEVTANYRKHLGIPKDAFVIGRHGGYDQFDVPFLPNTLETFLNNNSNAYLLLMNTKPLGFQHDRYWDVGSTSDRENIAGYINTCDVMLHGRTDGESFGLAISEFLFQNKPVITYTNSRDKNQMYLLKEHGYYYETPNELYSILTNFKRKDFDYNKLVEDFSPDKVMQYFKNVFLC